MCAGFIFREDLFSDISVLCLCIKEVLFPKQIFCSEIVYGIIVKTYFINISNLQRYGFILYLRAGSFSWEKLLKPKFNQLYIEESKPNLGSCSSVIVESSRIRIRVCACVL